MKKEESSNYSSAKLRRLEMLRNTLLDCRAECVNDKDEWLFYNEMSGRVYDKLTEERRKLGWMVVYPIINGSSGEALFEGTPEQCKIYVDIMKQSDHDAEVIVLQL